MTVRTSASVDLSTSLNAILSKQKAAHFAKGEVSLKLRVSGNFGNVGYGCFPEG